MKKLIILSISTILLIYGTAFYTYALTYTFDANSSIDGIQSADGIMFGSTTFNLLPVLDPTIYFNPSLSLGTVTNSEDQDWFLFQIEITNGGPIPTVTSYIPTAGGAVGVSRLGPGFTPTDGGSSLIPPTWEFNSLFTQGRISDQLLAAYSLGSLSGDHLVYFNAGDDLQRVLIHGDLISTSTPVPEPSTFLLLGGGLAGLAFYARRRKKE